MAKPSAVMRLAKYVTEAYANPSQFSDPQEYAQALTEALDDLTETFGLPLPEIEGAWS